MTNWKWMPKASLVDKYKVAPSILLLWVAMGQTGTGDPDNQAFATSCFYTSYLLLILGLLDWKRMWWGSILVCSILFIVETILIWALTWSLLPRS
jgi:hypothetical protein